MDLKELQLEIEDSINNGTWLVENTHRDIANQIFEELRKIDLFSAGVDDVKDMHENAISSGYEFLRNLNTVSGQTLRDIIDQFQR